MDKRSRAKKKKRRLPRYKRKLTFASVMAGLLILVLIGYLVYVGIIKGPEYTLMAQKQWSKATSLKADRGKIRDRNGNILAESYTTYQVCANPISISTQEDRERIAAILSAVLNLDPDAILAKLSKRNSSGDLYSQVKIKDQVEADSVRKLNSYQLGGAVSYYTDVKRNYPEGALFAQLLGFTDLDGNGQTGIEMTYNKYVSGTDGRQIVETDRAGNAIVGGSEEYTPAVAGGDVDLTVDTAVQKYMEDALGQIVSDTNAVSAYGILLNPKTGEILAVGCAPTFDPNSPPRSDALLLLDLSRQRVATDTFVPGSFFEFVTLAAGFDSGTITSGSAFNCSKKMQIEGVTMKCTLGQYHGKETLAKAVQQNCSLSFMTIALSMGRDAYYEYIYRFGFGESTHSGLTGETSGTVTHKKYIRDPELAHLSCGNDITVTGMEMASAFAACINGGKLLKPYVITRITDTSGTVVLENAYTVVSEPITPEVSSRMRELFVSYVESGAGVSAKIPGFSVGGFGGYGFKLDEDGNTSSTLMVCSFAGYAPADDPKYLCLIVVNEPQVPVTYANTLVAPYVQSVLTNTLIYYGEKPTSNTSNAVAVPNVVGRSVSEAVTILGDAGITAVYIEGEGAASVQRQYPLPGSEVARGSQVTLYTAWTTYMGVEEEIQYTTMPKVEGKSRLDALDTLTKAGLVMDYDRSTSYGTVIAAEYSEGTSLPVGSTVHVEFYYADDSTTG